MVVLLVLASGPALAQWQNDGVLAAPPGPIPGLYKGDAKKEIKAALATAAKKNQRVLLVFGGDWCYDCHVLEYNFRQDAALRPLLASNFQVVHVDIGRADKNLDIAAKYKINLDKGVPALAVLDPAGRLLYHDPGGFFEHARGMTTKAVADFLEQWAPPHNKS
jgi:thioredoxin-related protein